MSNDESVDSVTLLRSWVREGWKYRIARNPEIERRKKEYVERVNYEMKCIIDKEFTDYFLLLSDVVRFAKDSGIPVGPARGSAAASLVSYLIRITEIDPMNYPLMLFERFIDPTRADLPDIDLDFADDRRDEIRQYLIRKYGADRVGNIGNFVRYRGKNAVNDVARVYQIPQWEANIINNLVVERSGGDSRFDASLEDTFGMFPAAQAVLDKYPELSLAIALEGNVKGMSVHAAGLVVANTPITDICAMYARASGKEKRMTKVLSIDKYDAEYLDIMKIDALGLSTMGMIAIALDLIGMTLEELYNIPMDDEKTLKAFHDGDVVGIFQFEGRATRIVTNDVRPDNFLEVSDCNALSRPGPLFSGMTAEYVAVKHGKRPPEKLHPLVDEVTGPTKGQIVYQEQVLRIIKDIGGFPVTKVGEIRRIISKKMGEAQFNTMLEDFISGAKERHDIDRELAIRIWKFMVTSATYSFCCTGETVVERGGAGRNCPDPKATIADLYAAQQSKSPIGDKMRYGPGIKLLGMDDDGRVRPHRLIKIHDPVERNIIKITTSSGRVLRASREHKVLTTNGYVLFSDIKPGNFVIAMGEKEPPARSGKPTYREGKSYEGKGVPSGERNPGWIDGRSAALKQAQSFVRERAAGSCENCGCRPVESKHALEFAHMLSLEFLDGDYLRYNSSTNLLHLCNPCHKKLDYAKGERKIRWSRGRPTVVDEVLTVEDDGLDLVYDITMEGPSHNYVSNEIVSHNNTAHSISYSTLSFWCMFLKVYYPMEFYCAALIKAKVGGVISSTGSVAGSSGSNILTALPLIKDAKKHGIVLVSPDLRRSGVNWAIDRERNEIVSGFAQVKGLGEKISQIIVDDRETNGPFETWDDLLRVKGIGPAKLAMVKEFAENDDPFGLERTRKTIESVIESIRGKEIPVLMPTHNSDDLYAKETINRAVFVGMVKLKEYKDIIEDERSRSGDDVAEIRKRIKAPDLAKSCTLHCYDSGDEDVYVRINRFTFGNSPRIQKQLESIRPGQDVIVAFGEKKKVFGISFAVQKLWVIDPEM